MRISDLSSDVCSSDLPNVLRILDVAQRAETVCSARLRWEEKTCCDIPHLGGKTKRRRHQKHQKNITLIFIRTMLLSRNTLPSCGIREIGRAAGRERESKYV